jgi:hypothetical protein
MKLLPIVVHAVLLSASVLSLSLSTLAQSSIPANATATAAGGWTCNLGFKRAGDGCERVNVPPNASATYAGGWTCNLGFKRAGSECQPMTEQERQAQQVAISLMRARERSQVITLDDDPFTLADVERRCEAYVYDRQYGELECSGNVRILARRCEVYIYSWPNGEITCRGSELSVVERRCSVSMYSENYGSISC